MSKHSSGLFSIDKIVGFISIEIYPIISCLWEYEDKKIPEKDLLLRKSSGHTPDIGIISSSNNLYININNSCCSGLGIKIFS